MAAPLSSNSSGSEVSWTGRLSEWSSQFIMRLRGLFTVKDINWLFANIREYEGILNRQGKGPLSKCDILEIGFGARPFRLLALSSMGYKIRGLDIDQPVLHGSPSEFLEILRKNGVPRFVKSLVRYFLFDWQDRRLLTRSLQARGFSYRIDRDRFIVQGLASPELSNHFENESLDFCFSEDALEHIPKEDLVAGLQRLSELLRPDGVLFVRFTLFTGITGGHLVEWYPHRVDSDFARTSEPWEHLRKKRMVADTYLNRMRLSEYKTIIANHFEIVEECVHNPGLGEKYLTPAIREELRDYSEAELLSNEVSFVLKRKAIH